MGLTQFQKYLLQLLAENRSPDSVFAGGATLNRDRPRIPQNLDLQHWSKQAVEIAYHVDRQTLAKHGVNLEPTDRSAPHNGFAQAAARKAGANCVLEWTTESVFRFFPAVRDPEFGWRQHEHDEAVNKMLALTNRRNPRDYYDIVRLHQSGTPLAALAWAAPAKDAGLTPQLILAECARHSSYTWQELSAAINTTDNFHPARLKRPFVEALEQARSLFKTLPAEQSGNLYIDAAGKIALPNPDAVKASGLTLHSATPGGAWPTISPRPEPSTDPTMRER